MVLLRTSCHQMGALAVSAPPAALAEAPECFVCTESSGVLLTDICSCKHRHVHLACLKQLRRCTPAHSGRCAVCLAPYRAGLGGNSLWGCIRADATDVVLGSHFLLPQTLLFYWGVVSGCPLCPTVLRIQAAMLLGACLKSVWPELLRPAIGRLYCKLRHGSGVGYSLRRRWPSHVLYGLSIMERSRDVEGA